MDTITIERPIHDREEDRHLIHALATAAAETHRAHRDLASAVLALMRAHPEHETAAAAMAALGLDAAAIADVLALLPPGTEA